MTLAWKLVLLFSLSVNICFVIGYFHMQEVVKRYSTAHSRMGLMLDSLQLDDRQRPSMERAMDDWTQKMHNFQLAHVAEADRCWDVVQKADSPEQLTQEAIQSASEIQKGATIISLEFLRKIMLEMNTAQRMKLIERIRSGFKF